MTKLQDNSFLLARFQRPSSDVEFLREINADSPENLARLEALIAQGVEGQALFDACNELGQCVYQGPEDPNSLNNRYRSQFQMDLRKVLDVPQDEKHKELYPRDEFEVNRDSVERMRWLYSHKTAMETAHALNPPQLETAEDYIAYFESFHPAVLEQLMKNLAAIELTEGCPARCNKRCTVVRHFNIGKRIPSKALEWVFEKYGSLFKERKQTVGMYWGTDIKYWQETRDGEKLTAIDLIKIMYQEQTDSHYEVWSSTSFGLDRRYTVELLYQALKKDLPIHRISRLNGEDEADFEKLMVRMEERAAKDGRTLSEKDRQWLRYAFDQGDKSRLDTVGGREAASPEVEEHEISLRTYNCRSGVVLTPNGFKATIMRPASKVNPHADLQWPIVPDANGVLKMPQFWSIDWAQLPKAFDDERRHVMFEGRLISVDAEGTVLHKEPVQDLAFMLKTLNAYFHQAGKGIRGRHFMRRALFDRAVFAAKMEESPRAAAEWLEEDFRRHYEHHIKYITQVIELRAHLLIQYQDDMRVLLSMAEWEATFQSAMGHFVALIKFYGEGFLHYLEKTGLDVFVDDEVPEGSMLFEWKSDEARLKSLDTRILDGTDVFEENWEAIKAAAEKQSVKIMSHPDYREQFLGDSERNLLANDFGVYIPSPVSSN